MTVNDKKEDVLFCCWKEGTSGTILVGLAGSTNTKAKCETLVFKDGKLVYKGIGKGANADYKNKTRRGYKTPQMAQKD